MLRAPESCPRSLFYRRVALAPLCLCAVAALHAYRVSACRQTPWKGGGFGMFSTVGSEDSRFLRCWENGHTAVPVPGYLGREELRTRVAPSPQRLERFKGLLAESEQTPVVVELWKYRFDPQTGKLVAEKWDDKP